MTRIYPMCVLSVMLMLALTAFSVPSYAERIDLDGLTEEQGAELRLEAAKMRNEQDPAKVSERMAEYAEIGQKYGVALAATAKELGVAADELLDTTVGKVALVLIIWKVMGSELIGLLIGIPWLLIGSAIWLYLFRRMCIIESVVKEPFEKRFLRKKTVVYHASNSRINGTRWGMVLCSILVWLPAVIMIFG